MTDDIDEQVAAHIREILRLILDVKGKTLRELNEHIGQTSKFELQCIINIHAKVIMVQNYHVEIGQGDASSLPICIEFKHLRRSSRLPRAKRNYGTMQGPNTRTGRLAKKPKLPDDECLSDALPTDGPLKEPATDGFTNETPTEPYVEHPSEHPSEHSS